MDEPLTILLDSNILDSLRKMFPGTDPADYVRTFFESCMVDGDFTPPPARYGVGRQEFLTCARDAVVHGVPVGDILAERKARVARAVEKAFRR